MSSPNPETRWSLSPDAVKLILVFAAFDFVFLYLLSSRWLLDFASFYTAGHLILHGQGHAVFNTEAQAAFQLRTFGLHGVLPFNHLAYEALLAVPFALFPFTAALWLWRVVSAALYFLACRLLARVYRLNPMHTAVLAAGFFPVAYALIEGQDSALLLLLVTASLSALERDRPTLAGAFLALALFKPHLILPLAIFLVWKKGLRFLAGFSIGTLAVLALSTAVTGLQAWHNLASLWRQDASKAGHSIGVFSAWMPNLHGLLLNLGLRGVVGLVLVAVLSLALCLLAFWQLRGQRSAAALFPPVVVLTMLISFHLNIHDLSLLMVPVAAFAGQNTKSAHLAAAACFSIVLFGIFGHIAPFALVLCGLLWFSLRQARASQNATAA